MIGHLFAAWRLARESEAAFDHYMDAWGEAILAKRLSESHYAGQKKRHQSGGGDG